MRLNAINLVLISLQFLCFGVRVFSQEMQLTHYDDKYGLHSRINYMISQNREGYLLLSSDNGLYRFDGVEFVKMLGGTDLDNKEILQSVPLPNGDIGLSLYYDNYFYVLKTSDVKNQDRLLKFHFPNSNYFQIIGVDAPKNIIYFIVTMNGEHKIYQYSNDKIKSYLDRHFNLISGFDFRRGLVYSKKLDTDLKRTICLITDEKTNQTKIAEIDYLKYGNFLSAEGKWIILKKDAHLYLFSNKGKVPQLQKTLLLEEDIAALQYSEDELGNLWVYNLKSGTNYYPISESKEAIIKPRSILKGQTVNHVFVDKDKNVWFSTKNSGLYMMTSHYFLTYLRKNLYPIELPITAIRQSENQLFLGLRNSGFIQFPFIGEPKKYHFDNVISETRDIIDHKNDVLLAQNEGRLWKFNKTTKEFSKVLPKTFEGFGNDYYFHVKSFSTHNDKEVLLTNYHGLHTFIPEDNHFNLLTNGKGYSSINYARDSVFFGTFDNVYKLKVGDSKKELLLSKVYFNQMKALSSQTFVGASNNRGIVIFNSRGIIREINLNDGLLSNQILSVHVENNQVIWASSTQGLYRIELQEKPYVELYTEADGLFSANVIGNVVHEGKNYIASNKGLTIISLDKMLFNRGNIQKPTYINSVQIGDKLIQHPGDIGTTYDQNSIQIHLSFLDFNSGGRIRFKYRLKGIDDDWRISSSNRISYSSLPPGHYVFEAIGLASNNLASNQPASFDLHVRPLYWQTLWFRTLFILLILAILGYILWNYREKKIRKLQFDKKVGELELQAIKAQFNPHFIYNCLNTIQYLIYKQSVGEAEHYLNRFSKMIRKTLQYSEYTFITIQEEAEYLTVYLEMEKMRFKDRFTFLIDISEDVDRNIKIPSLLIQPYVENAIKHGIVGNENRNGHIKVSFNRAEQGLLVEIEDNGRGFDVQQRAKGSSFGLKLSSKRMETYNKLFHTAIHMELSSEIGKFTKIKIYIHD